MTTKVEPTVDKWESVKTIKELREWALFFLCIPEEGREISDEEFVDAIIKFSVQEAKAEMVEKIEKIMDKDRAKEIGDNIEIAFGERSCKVCGYNPEYQREYILASLKQEEEK